VNVVVWVVTCLLAVLFLAAGSMKLVKSKEQLAADPRMGWAEAFPAPLIKLIALAEVLGAAGLVLPGALDVATWLVPAAALGLAVIMVGALLTHARRAEWQALTMPFVLLVLSVFVAVERLGPQSF
jgi:uncharacterized membrane protein YphA (DoxX/SURF4 family)